MSSQYSADPVPSNLDPALAEYLNRQLQGIEIALRSDFQAPRMTEVPQKKVIGAVILVRNKKNPAQDGFWVCIENSQGEGEWKMLHLA